MHILIIFYSYQFILIYTKILKSGGLSEELKTIFSMIVV